MEPSSLSRSNKRKRDDASASHTKIRRVKSEVEAAGPTECLHHPPRISAPASHLQQPVTLDGLMELLHYAALGKSSGVQQPSWCRLHHQRRIEGVNVVVLEGLTQSHFYKHFLNMQHLRTNYTTRRSFTPSSIDVPTGIFSSEVNSSISHREQQSQPLATLIWHPVIRRFGKERKGLTAYTLTQEDMIKKHFPVRGMPGFEDFSSTDADGSVSDNSPLYGLDCEMCLTEKGIELARVSLVDSGGKCLLDELVKPPNRVINYLTRFSGITAAMLQPITATLRDVQAKLRMLLPPDAVLVGHSLENDLRALKLIHPHVIDVSLLYRRELGHKFKLKVLAETVLEHIQTDEREGHHPTEDAVAALELAQYFIKTGPRRVVELHLQDLWGGSPSAGDNAASEPAESTRFADVLERSGQSVAFIGKRADVTLDLSNQQWHNSDKEVLGCFQRRTKCLSFSVLQFSSFSDHLKNSFLDQGECYRSLGEHLKPMCVVFAGPFPGGFSEADVRRLFRCCGAVQSIRMLHTTQRIHAEVEFSLLEGAALAMKTLNGLNVCGHQITVQRPVHKSTLDLDLTLAALMEDALNVNQLYAVRVKPTVDYIPIPANAKEHTADFKCSLAAGNKIYHDKANGSAKEVYHSELSDTGTQAVLQTGKRRHNPSASKLSEEQLNEAFGHFGLVERILLPVKPSGRRVRHARIKFQSSEAVQAALSSSEELRRQRYLICPALTPCHLRSWGPTITPMSSVDSEKEAALKMDWNLIDNAKDWKMGHVMRKLDCRLRKLFKSLPDCTLSVVLLPGHVSSHGCFSGLCFMEVKRGSS